MSEAKAPPIVIALLSTLVGAVTAGFGSCGPAHSEDDYAVARERLLREIEADVQATRRQTGRARLDPRVMEAIAAVPRHEFVPRRYRDRAYENRPLPIGEGQTISQPYVVALMTDLLELRTDDRVLEVGTGSGYQAAVLAELAAGVYTVEIIPELGEEARRRLGRLGYDNVEVRIGDGYEGWEEHAPFDAVIVTAAAEEIPPPLVEQLAPGGRLVMPRGGSAFGQELVLVEKTREGDLREREVLPVRFVPLTGDHE